MNIRKMSEQDWPLVSQIFEEGLQTGVATFQRGVPSYEQWNATHLTTCRLVIESDQGTVIGWAALSPVSSRVAYRGVAEVSIYIASPFRGKSLGKQLL
ncbi:MAG TPA: GNAT family N-acetyltransferase, partial [Sphaerochaetaceae bacterium]|nr:GNAT family N-acetyltransferase [Sphaerochaetaceae bacterium]